MVKLASKKLLGECLPPPRSETTAGTYLHCKYDRILITFQVLKLSKIVSSLNSAVEAFLKLVIQFQLCNFKFSKYRVIL